MEHGETLRQAVEHHKEITTLAIIGICGVLTLTTVTIHLTGLVFLRKKIGHLAGTDVFLDHVVQETLFVSAMVISLCVLHVLEIIVWAGAYVALGGIKDLNDAIYFSTTMYTTVGPDQVEVAHRYRSVAGYQSLLGPIMIAWSTAFLLNFTTVLRGHAKH